VPNTPEGGAAADASDALTALLAGAEQAQKEEDAAAEEQKEQAAEEGDEHSNDDGTKWVVTAQPCGLHLLCQQQGSCCCPGCAEARKHGHNVQYPTLQHLLSNAVIAMLSTSTPSTLP
jgi:hypothetical protein